MILICLAALALSCKAPSFMMGMTEGDFKKQNRSATMVSATADHTVIYRVVNDIQHMYNFFYFRDGKLIRFEESGDAEGYKFLRRQ